MQAEQETNSVEADDWELFYGDAILGLLIDRVSTSRPECPTVEQHSLSEDRQAPQGSTPE